MENAKLPLHVATNIVNGNLRIADATGRVLCTLHNMSLEEAIEMAQAVSAGLITKLAKQW